jgi:hypothetical protein
MSKWRTFFVSWGRSALMDAQRGTVEKAVRERYSEALANAGPLRRLYLTLRISREIQQELNRLAPRGALYLR